MENIIVSIICIALLMFGGMTMSQGFLSSMDSSKEAWAEMGQRDNEIHRTVISNLRQPSLGHGHNLTILDLRMENSGQTKLSDFEQWDVIVQYYDTSGQYHVAWLPYVEGTLGDNQWKVQGIYMDANTGDPEVFEPGILNPGEGIRMRAKLYPAVDDDTTNLAIVSVANGISASAFFYGYD